MTDASLLPTKEIQMNHIHQCKAKLDGKSVNSDNDRNISNGKAEHNMYLFILYRLCLEEAYVSCAPFGRYLGSIGKAEVSKCK